MVLLDRQQVTTYVICCMQFAYWITETTGPHSESVILIAFSIAVVVNMHSLISYVECLSLII